jgi:RHS repeat-associated protein
MANETVTKSARFYCVSLTPDICKTPVGNSTPPLPYNIIGKFKDAVNVSPNVKAHTEPLFLHGKSSIPTVKGDAAGKANGVKSSTVGDKVEAKQHSSTFGSNASKTVQVGLKFWMNSMNTIGKALQKKGQEARAFALPYAKKYKEEISPSVHEFGQEAMDKGGKVAIAGTTAVGAGGLLSLTGPGAVVGVPLAIGGGAAATTGGVVTAVGGAAETGATLLDAGADAIIEGKMPDIAGAAENLGMSALNFLTRKLPVPGIKGKLSEWQKKRKAAQAEKKAKGGKTEEPKKKPEDKPSDCCPKNEKIKSKKPVHFGTGEEILHQTDFVLESANSFVWTRCYRSGSEAEDWGLLGARWSTPFSSSLSVCKQGVVYHEDSGRALRLPALAIGETHNHLSEGFVLQRDSETEFSVVWRDGSADRFVQGPDGWLPHGYQGVNARLAPRAPVRTQRYYLAFSTARDGTYTAIERLHHAQPGEVLMRIHAVDGQVIEAIRDAQDAIEPTLNEGQPRPVRMPPTPRIGRVEELRPDGSRICHVRYTYVTEPEDAAELSDVPAAHYKFTVLPQRHNLVAQTNVLGEQRTYGYQHHLLLRYTNYSDFADGLAWISLAALRERWAGSTLSDQELTERHPITLANSYQAQATRNLTADGNDEVIIDYIEPYRTRVTDSGGGVREYSFNSQWLCTHIYRISADGGKPKSLGRRDWDRDGQLIADIDSEGNTTRFTYDDAGNLTSITDPKRRTTHIEYNSQNLPIAVTDALGNVTQRSFDPQGRITHSTDALGRTTSYAYNAEGRLSTLTDAKGGTKQLAYDHAGRLVQYTDCSQLTSHYAYDNHGRLSTTTNALGQSSAYDYDALGRVTQVTYPDNTIESYAYNSDGNLLAHTDAKGQVTQYQYNGHGLPIKRIDAKGQPLRYHYDKALRLVKLTNANGEIYSFTYDIEGRLLSETGFDRKTTAYTYDKAGQLIASECNGLHANYMRDAQGLLQAKTTTGTTSGSTPDAITRYAYDALDRLTSVASPQAQQHFIYDSAGQLIEERIAYALTAPGADSVRMPEPGQLPQPPAITTAFKLTHTYDELGNRLQTTLPHGRTIDTQRYGSGHWHGTLWQGRTIVDLERDHLHREVTRHWGTAKQGPATSSAQSTAQALSSQRSYDPQSRLQAISLHQGNKRLRQRSYSYDRAGNLSDIADSQHGLTTYSYDPIGQLLSAVQPHIRETFAFDAAGNLLDSPAGNSLDPSTRSKQYDSPINDDATLPLGKQRPLQEQPVPSSKAARRPVQQAQLAQVTHNLLKQYLGHSYKYDIQGNTVLKRHAFTALNDPSASANQAAETAFAYDADNRLVQATRTWAQADSANGQPDSKAQQTTRYSYDAFGRRIAKQVTEQNTQLSKTETTLFVWDGDVLIQEIHRNYTVTYVYEPGSFVPLARVQSSEGFTSYRADTDAVHLPKSRAWDMPKDRHAADAHTRIYQAHQADLKEQAHQAAWQQRLNKAQTDAANDTIHYYQCDHLGTPLELMDASGRVVWAARYKAWGRILRYEQREVEQPLRFQGQYEDTETGLHYNRHRYYDPDQARYLTQDPIGLLGGLNNYQYAPNTTNWVDPLGLTKCHMTLYRGGPENASFFKSHAANQQGYAKANETLKNGNMNDLMTKHALDSKKFASPMISLTTDPRVAEYFATAGGTRSGTVHTLKVPCDEVVENKLNNMVVPAGPNGSLISEQEWLLKRPYIKPSEVIGKVRV